MSRTETLSPHVRDRSLASLADALDTEARLLQQLARTLCEQRDGVADDDVQRVDDSVHATHRIIQTLGEARTQRGMLVQLLTDLPDVPLSALADALGDRMTDELRHRQQALEELARSVSRDVGLNRILLERALENGENHARSLLRPVTSAGTYGGQGKPTGGVDQAVLINRKV